jgi:enolase
MTIQQQLTDIYLNKETWHEKKLSYEESIKYHEHLLESGNIIVVRDGDRVIGYVEFWRLTYEQFGRVICGEPLSAMHEDVQTGQIAYLANVFIEKDYRNGGVYKMMKKRFFEANTLCTHFVGEARRKPCAPVKVFKRNQVPERI